MDINNLSLPPGEDIFYSKGFMDTLESHMDFFRKSINSTIVDIDNRQSDVYNGDLFGYLNEVGIEIKYHWVFMRVNGLYSSSGFTKNIRTLILPSRDQIEKIRSAYVATGQLNL